MTSPEGAAILAETIDFAHKRGLVRWVWVLDSALVRLQVKRIARGPEHVFVETWHEMADPEAILAAARETVRARTRHVLQHVG